jgi:hypothetical protein
MVCDTAVEELINNDPADVLTRWDSERAGELSALLRGDLCDDKG